MFAVATIAGELKKNAFVVPATAVKTTGNLRVIYEAVDYAEYRKSISDSDTSVVAVLNNPAAMVAVERSVEAGISFEEKMEIISGIENDLRIVTVGAQSLADGDFITVKKSEE